MEPIFLLDIHDKGTGKRVAIRIGRDEALLPVGELLCRTLQTEAAELVASARLAPEQADTFFRMQDLVFPVQDDGALAHAPYERLTWRHGSEGFAYDPARPGRFERVRRAHAPDLLILPVAIDRRDQRYGRNWRGFHARRYRRFGAAAARLIAEALPEGVRGDSPAMQRRFVEAVARRIWRADFENYSRFLSPACGPGAGIALKTGDETVENILAGRGGVCTEKVLALKFITDAHGIESRPVFAGPRATGALPAERLREMLDELDTYDFTYARRYLRYWDHVALEYRLADGSRWLVDPSNGNIPFLCEPAGPYLDRRPGRRTVPVRMLAVEEPVTYHRAPDTLAEDFLFAWETWIADMDLLQVFDNHLGLIVAEDFVVMPIVWGSREKRAVALDSWRRYAREHDLAVGLAADATTDTSETATYDDFRVCLPGPAAWCTTAAPGLAARYRAYILARYGIEKSWGVDLVVLDRRAYRQDTPEKAGHTAAAPGTRG